MIELPSWDALPGDADRCLARVDVWAETLRDHPVVAEFSESSARQLSGLRGAELSEALDVFAAGYWNFRGGRERNLAACPEFSTIQAAAIDDAAARLGLMGTLPPRRRKYDAVIMTGGMVRAGIVKPRYARELYDSGVRWKEAVFLGGFRALAGDELTLAPLLGVKGVDEFDSMVAGMRSAFELGDPDTVGSSAGEGVDLAAHATGNSGWREDSWGWNGCTLRVLAAPSSDPLIRRANTVDTYRFWAASAQGIRSVLVMTTPVYVPYQGAGAIEVLGAEFGFSVETVAVSASASDLGEHSQSFLPQHRAQEMRSAVHGMRSLRARITGPASDV